MQMPGHICRLYRHSTSKLPASISGSIAVSMPVTQRLALAAEGGVSVQLSAEHPQVGALKVG